jgi:hypothetical protein
VGWAVECTRFRICSEFWPKADVAIELTHASLALVYTALTAFMRERSQA